MIVLFWLASAVILALLAIVPLDWKGQAELGLVLVALSMVLGRISSKRRMTLALIAFSIFSSTRYPEDQEYRLALGRLYTYRPQTRDRGIQLLESIPESSALANQARQAWRQALVWDGAHPASAPFYRSFLARYKDPELQQMLSEMKVPAAATVENKADLSRGREEKLGYAALNADRLPEAEGHFQAALKESSGSAGGLSGLGFISMKKEDFDSAVDYFERAKSAAPASKQIAEALDTARFWKNMKAAGGAQNDNRLDAATELFRQALAMRPGNVDAAAGLAGAYMQQGKAAPAIPLYQEIVHQTTAERPGLARSGDRQIPYRQLCRRSGHRQADA